MADVKEERQRNINVKLTLGGQVTEVPILALFAEGSTRVEYIVAQNEEAAKEIARSVLPEGMAFVLGKPKRKPSQATPVYYEQDPVEFNNDHPRDKADGERRIRNYAIAPLD